MIPTMNPIGVGGLGSMPQPNGGSTSSVSNLAGNIANSYEITNPNLDVKLNQTIGNWMTWCQTCKHGGHA